MARMRRQFVAGVALLSVAMVVAAGVAGASPATAAGGGPVGVGGSLPGVVGSADGWLTYTHTLAGTLALRNGHTATLSGQRSADGGCVIGSSSSPASPTRVGGATHFTEEVGFNPRTCQERVLSADLTPSAAAQLNALKPAGSAQVPTTTTSTVPAARSPRLLSPAATSYQTAYTKTAWIDPLNITITSLANNFTWPLYGAGGTLTARAYPYEFPYDGWSSSGVTFSPFYSISGGWYIHAYDHFTNTDFASFVYVVFGVAGWLACGAPLTVTAHFNHDVSVYGYSNNSRNRAWNDTATGACTDLVHHSEWDGFGTSQ